MVCLFDNVVYCHHTADLRIYLMGRVLSRPTRIPKFLACTAFIFTSVEYWQPDTCQHKSKELAPRLSLVLMARSMIASTAHTRMATTKGGWATLN
eukprot:scaffold67266_cov43-Cyclotella_meneghiniana.AAC.2